MIQTKRARALLAVFTLLVPSTTLSAQTAEQRLAAQFVGAWRLASWEHQYGDGTTRQDPRTVAFLMYSGSGRMCFMSMDPNRPEWASPSDPTPEEARSAIMGLGGYCGRVEINAGEGYVLHHVELAGIPNSVGIVRRRTFEFRGPDELILSPDPAELSPPQVGMRLTWQRIRN